MEVEFFENVAMELETADAELVTVEVDFFESVAIELETAAVDLVIVVADFPAKLDTLKLLQELIFTQRARVKHV